MSLELIKKIFSKTPKDWQVTAMIYKVSEPLQGRSEPTEEEQAIIDEIGQLRVRGKLNAQQLKILNEMQWYRIDGSDEF